MIKSQNASEESFHLTSGTIESKGHSNKVEIYKFKCHTYNSIEFEKTPCMEYTQLQIEEFFAQLLDVVA